MSKIDDYKQMMNKVKLPNVTYTKLMDLPNDSNRKQSYRLNQRKTVWRLAAACLVLTLMCGGTAYAAFKFLSSSQVADRMGYDSVKKLFESSKSVKVNETQKFGEYQVTYLGMTTTTDIQNYGLQGNFESDTMYSVLALKRTDGKAIKMPTQDNETAIDYYVTPIIRGVDPTKVNAFTMNGSTVKMVKDGVLYILYSQETLEKFADMGVYLAVMKGRGYNEKAYISKDHGELTRNPDYKEVNALFEMPLDRDYANNKEAKRLLDFWSDQTKDESAKSKIELTHCWNNWSDSSIEEMFTAFEDQICVRKDQGSDFTLDFYSMNGDKLGNSVQIPISNGYIRTYSTKQYVVVVTAHNEKKQFVVINEQHEIVINSIFEKKMESSDTFIIAPESQKIIFSKESEDKKGWYFEISSCNYDGSELQSIYKVYTDKKETIGKLESIYDANLSKNGKTIFFTGEYFESRESGSSSKQGIGAIDLETGKLKFIHGGNDSLAETLENEAIYISNSGSNCDVVFMDAKGKCRTISLEKASELPYVYVSGDGKMIYTVSEKSENKNRLSHVIKCYRVSDNKVLWSTGLDSTYAVRSLINNGKLLVLCANQDTNQYVMMSR